MNSERDGGLIRIVVNAFKLTPNKALSCDIFTSEFFCVLMKHKFCIIEIIIGHKNW